MIKMKKRIGIVIVIFLILLLIPILMNVERITRRTITITNLNEEEVNKFERELFTFEFPEKSTVTKSKLIRSRDGGVYVQLINVGDAQNYISKLSSRLRDMHKSECEFYNMDDEMREGVYLVGYQGIKTRVELREYQEDNTDIIELYIDSRNEEVDKIFLYR